ncbi:PREDICTED: nucleoporin-62 C-terminal-like protein [Hipposideros armiger]|uniref:Nucleoporin-62 C-terminal-like protein n=1 Tax=Hipposideros armiger TaxID=186990 RepID=A0A8B7SUI0_HIPAR|nr:PREDICTED: nucleoporin-62 C-terminal-like protein [Hipposideros armiger]
MHLDNINSPCFAGTTLGAPGEVPHVQPRGTGLTPASAVATTTSSSTMSFTSRTNVSTSTAAAGPSFGAITTLNGMHHGTTSGFGFRYSGVNAVASTTPIYFPAQISTITTITVTTTFAGRTSATHGLSFDLQSLISSGINNTVSVSAIKTPVMTCGQKDSMITILRGKMEKTKLHQKRLEQELAFVLSQQLELEDLLTNLEVAVKELSRSVDPQHGDEEFEKTMLENKLLFSYKLAENIDAQMKGMAQDLKDITEHLNMFGRPADTTEPVC